MARLGEKLKASWDSFAIGIGVFLFHLWHAPAVAHGGLFGKDNLPFDFDVLRFSKLWGASPFPVLQNTNAYAVRHPLMVALRLVCRPLVDAGFDMYSVACGVAAVCAGLSSVLAFRIALALGVQRGVAYVMTALWTLSAVSLLLGVLPESYDLAFLALGWQFLLAIRWARGRVPPLWARIAAAVANFGITITNVALCAVSELVCRLTRQPVRQALTGAAGVGAVAGVIAILLSLASFHFWPTDQTGVSASGVKQVYWSAASAERTTERQPPAEVAWTFAATAFAVPPPARYASGDNLVPYLYDFRGRAYDAAGWIATLSWLGLLALGIVVAAGERQLRPVWLIAALWILGNIALHSYWQFRDSLFLYSPHTHIAFFLFALAGARWTQERFARGALVYGGAAALVTAFVALNNLPVYLELPALK